MSSKSLVILLGFSNFSVFCDMNVHDFPAAVCRPAALPRAGETDTNCAGRGYACAGTGQVSSLSHGFGNLCPNFFIVSGDVYKDIGGRSFKGVRRSVFENFMDILNRQNSYWQKYQQGSSCIRVAMRQRGFFESLWMQSYLENVRTNLSWQSLSGKVSDTLGKFTGNRYAQGFFPSPHFPD